MVFVITCTSHPGIPRAARLVMAESAYMRSILLVSLGLVPAVFIDEVRAFGCIEPCRRVSILVFPESRV